ncbi:MAG: restriction endonuclease subunit S [Sedimenticola sp.]
MRLERVRLADVVSMRTGKLDSNAAVQEGEYPFFTCSQKTLRIDKPAFDTKAVLLGGNNAAGVFPLKYYEGQFNAYQRTYVIESLDPEKLSINFLYYALRPALSYFQSASIGAATQYLTKGILDDFVVALPQILEQQHIASVLSAYDDLIENNWRRIQLLEQAARLLYKEWFVHLRFPGHEHVKIKDGVPEGWEKGTVINLGRVVTGKTPSTKISENFSGDVQFVKTPDMHRSRILVETEEHLSERGIATQANKTLPAGTILVACIGAKLGVVSITGRLSQTNQQINAVIPHKDYLRYFSLFALIDLKPQLEAMGGGATMPNVNKTKFSSIPVVIPPPILLREFDEFAKTSFQQMQLLNELISRLTKARDHLLPRLMNGSLVV